MSELDRENRRSLIRLVVTCMASAYAFGVPVLLLVMWLALEIPEQKMMVALAIYALASNLASMVIGWWFAKRDGDSSKNNV